ncbi:hypothetical protein FANTH_14053 [Fusarium anthophilum]|uniref:Uncharacterized protein n=1 Tax=Fusarium anthophilum TaxID=48485 RepID=A0A8H4YL32_9HYPO|nr:hypothetical protein FANTH_14053 [Fusarium anthophilum]
MLIGLCVEWLALQALSTSAQIPFWAIALASSKVGVNSGSHWTNFHLNAIEEKKWATTVTTFTAVSRTVTQTDMGVAVTDAAVTLCVIGLFVHTRYASEAIGHQFCERLESPLTKGDLKKRRKIPPTVRYRQP